MNLKKVKDGIGQVLARRREQMQELRDLKERREQLLRDQENDKVLLGINHVDAEDVLAEYVAELSELDEQIKNLEDDIKAQLKDSKSIRLYDARKTAFVDPRTGERISRQQLFEYDGPERLYTSVEAYLKEEPVYGEDYKWVHPDGTPLSEDEINQLKFK